MIAVFAVASEASVYTQRAQQLSNVQARVHKSIAKEDRAAAPAPAAAPAAALPEQGFEGKGIAHKDMDTYTGDFGKEYGPKGPPMHVAACKDARDHKICEFMAKGNAKSTTVLVGIMLTVAQFL